VSTSLTGNVKIFEIESKLWIMAATSQVAITNIENETVEALPRSSFSFLSGEIIPIKVRVPTASTAHKSVTSRDSGKAQSVNVGILGSPANSTGAS